MPRVPRLLLIASAAAFAWGAAIIVTGGIEWRVAGVLFRSRAPDRALFVALVLLVVQALVFREAFARDTARIAGWLRPLLPAIALACAAALTVHAVRFSSCTAGSSDSYGYVSQAYGWASGQLPHPETLPISVPWPSGDLSLAPLGYRPGPRPHTMVPTYAPGLPLIMAATVPFGPCGPFMVVPISAGLAVWLTFLLGRRTGGPWTGILGAVFLATSPVVLFQSLAPMSDVPAAAICAGALYAALGARRRDTFVSGLWTAAALMVRPNLPLVPLVLFVHVAASAAGRERWIRLALFSIPVGLAGTAIAALYTLWYGAPWHSGYGSAGELFSLSSVMPNLARYPVWLWRSQSPLILLAAIPLLPPFNRDGNRRAIRLLGALFAATLFSYLVYFPFEEWWYLRFLLPAMPALLMLTAAGLVAACRRLPAGWGRTTAAAVATVMVIVTARFSNTHAVPAAMKDGERRYVDVGAHVNAALPSNAVVLSVQESGSVRYYGGRLTIRWDLIDRDWVVRAPQELEAEGFHPYLVAEDFELPQVRDWFGLASGAALPWPLAARMRERGGVSIFDLAVRPAVTAPFALEGGRMPLCARPLPLVIERRLH